MTPLLPQPARMVSYIRPLIRACVSSIVMPSNLRTGEGRSGKGSRWRIRLAAKERSPDQATRRHGSCWEADVCRAVQDKQVCWRIDEGKRAGYYFLFPITVLITISFCFFFFFFALIPPPTWFFGVRHKGPPGSAGVVFLSWCCH